MKAEDKDYLLKIYHQSLATYGDTPEAVQWSNASQRYRFKVLTEIAPLEGATLLDYGCGKGDLYQYLVESGFRGTYTGFDINRELLDVARTKYPGVRFEQCDIEETSVNETFEYVLISGIFNNRISDNDGFIRSVLKRCFNLAKCGLAFNAISTYASRRDQEMYYSSPEAMFQFCMTELSPWVTLRHDNVPYNFAIYVYRKAEWQRL
jgi:2-polyprenyl-3-methyl-5-hydroxy-6-metoxy-1,4-benzoquinol methylase